MKELYAKEYAEFITVTCLDWKLVLSDDRFKDIIVDSLNYLSKEKRIWLYAFVIMNNHFHLIWQMVNEKMMSTGYLTMFRLLVKRTPRARE